MSEDARGDDVYQPVASDMQNRPDDDLDMENSLDERGLDEQMEDGYVPLEQPLAVEKYGTTNEEARLGESLDQRLAQEAPDVAAGRSDGIGDLTADEGEPWEDLSGEQPAESSEPWKEPSGSRTIDMATRHFRLDGGAEEPSAHLVDEEAEPTDPER